MLSHFDNEADILSIGAWAARYLALLINRLGGLPKDADDFPYSQLYKACDNKSIWKDGVAEVLMKEHERKSFQVVISM